MPSDVPPSAPFSSGCGRQSVCAKYCCEHWVLSQIKHKHIKKESTFPLSPYHEPQAPAWWPAARYNSTPRHTVRGLAGHPQSVRLGSGDNKTRLYTSIRLKTPAIWWHGLHIGSAQHHSRPARRCDEFSGERSRGNGFPSSERVRLPQSLLPRPQEGWWSKAHPRSQTSESRPYEMAVQDDYIEEDPLANMPRGLVLFARSERRLLWHPYSPPPQYLRFLRFAFEGVAYQYTVHPFGLSLAPHTFTKSMDVVLSPAETDGNSHPELPRRLAHFGLVGGWASIS